MRVFSIVLLVIAALSFSSCKKDDNPASSVPVTYSNKITFGTGIGDGGALNEEGTTFTRTNGSGRIYFRVESTEDFATTGVLVKIEKKIDTAYVVHSIILADKAYITGHTYRAYFDVTDPTSYRATGLLYTTNALIASATCTVK
jgi:hypothetical protein